MENVSKIKPVGNEWEIKVKIIDNNNKLKINIYNYVVIN